MKESTKSLGRKLHKELLESGLELNELVYSSLISMYTKCGRLQDAQTVWSSVPPNVTKTLASWNNIINAHALHGKAPESLELFDQMLQQDVKPDKITFSILLYACRFEI